jgi:hypothetical protein
MTAYRNFTVDLPKRLSELDRQFQPVAKSADLDVSYLLMKLAACFLLPYERIEGSSGVRPSEKSDPRSIRKHLELDKQFHESTYCSDIVRWFLISVDDFRSGPRAWLGKEAQLHAPVHRVLTIVRHSVAHSNLFFGGENTIEHIYLGSRQERDPKTNKYTVVRCGVPDLNALVNAWIANVEKLRVSPALIWTEMEKAA